MNVHNLISRARYKKHDGFYMVYIQGKTQIGYVMRKGHLWIASKLPNGKPIAHCKTRHGAMKRLCELHFRDNYDEPYYWQD